MPAPAPASSGEPGPGERLGPYRVVRRLGAGGMGTVLEAVDTVLGRRVALKLIARDLADDPVFRARFVREAQAQASLDSAHVVQVFAHGEIGGRLYIASQLVPDGDLAALLAREGALAPSVAVDVVAQVAEALGEAHRTGLVHGDVKPANVLLRRRGPDVAAYLADFGIARRADAGRTGGPGVAAGTPSAMAPELHDGAAASPASDVYAVGCLLWSAITGRAPYAAASDGALARAHRTSPLPQLPGRTRWEREVNAVLRRALAKDPSDRAGAADVLCAELRRIRAVGARASRRPARRAKRVPVVAAGLAAALTAVLAAVLAAVTTAVMPAAVLVPGSPPSAGPSGEAERAAVVAVAAGLRTEAGLGAADAECTARALVDEHGVDGLRDSGLLDPGPARAAQLDPRTLSEVLSSTFSCLFATTGGE